MADDPSAIRADIADTRERLSNTIGEIGERLNPQVLKENVKDSIREATIGRVSTMAQQAVDSVSRTTNGVGTTIRENPIPVAMVAIGLGWLIWNTRSDDNKVSPRRIRNGADVGYGPDYGKSYGNEYGQQFGQSYESTSFDTPYEAYAAGAGSPSITDRARETADQAKQRTRQVAESVRDRAQQAASRAQQAYGNAADVTRRSAMRVEDAFHENPMVIGAVAMAIGLAAGMAAPVTDREVRLMGDARDDLVDRVKDIADETRTKAEHVASRVAQEAKTAAREEGLTGTQPPRPTV